VILIVASIHAARTGSIRSCQASASDDERNRRLLTLKEVIRHPFQILPAIVPLRRGGRRHEIAPRYCYRHVCVSDGASRHGRGLAVSEDSPLIEYLVSLRCGALVGIATVGSPPRNHIEASPIHQSCSHIATTKPKYEIYAEKPTGASFRSSELLHQSRLSSK
jgi:hypothetical protein